MPESKNDIIVPKTRLRGILYLILFTPLTIGIFAFALSTLFSASETDTVETIFAIFSLIMGIFMLIGLIYIFLVLFSSYPAYKITSTYLRVYDNFDFEKIYFHDLEYCQLCYNNKAPDLLGLIVKPESALKGNNSNRFKFINNIHEKFTVIYLSLEHAKINSYRFVEILNERIRKVNEETNGPTRRRGRVKR
jgi:hypothetical protein